jgi:hypothetical protein
MLRLARFGHGVLAALLLLSSSGITLNKHFCRGELRSQALFVRPTSCHAQAAAGRPACPFHDAAASPEEDAENGCCDERSIVLKQDGPSRCTPSAGSFPCQSCRCFWVLLLLPGFFRLPRLFARAELGLRSSPPKVALRILFQVFRI